MPVTVYQSSCNKIIPRTCPCCDEPFESAELVADGTYAELLANYEELDPLNFILLNAAE